MKTFHDQLAKQLIAAKSDAAVKEETHKNKLGANFRYKITFFLNIFALHNLHI
jgi:hypothetical protein